MKTLFIPLIVLSTLSTPAQSLYDKESIKLIMDKVNQYQLDNPWAEFDDNWIRGTYYTGVMACYQATGDKKYLDQCNELGEKLNWQIPSLKPDHSASGVNLLTIGQTWLESYIVKKKKYKIKPIIDHLENPEIRNPVSNPMKWYFEGGRRYVDGLFTGPPTLVMLYSITRNDKYLHWMEACFWDVYGELFDLDEGLFYRDVRWRPGYSGNIGASYSRPASIPYEEARRSYVYQETKSGEKVIWSRGNGWALAGLARILKYLPSDFANYERYKAVFIHMAEELKNSQQPDGFWYPNLADPEDYGCKESSGTGFFTYGLVWGINNGILPREDFLPVVEKSWAALYSSVSKEGKVQWGQLVGAAPYKILQEDSHEYVSGTFLLAASEVYKLKK
jgi:unsaturated rhamnogalacturonyl hydrolase